MDKSVFAIVSDNSFRDAKFYSTIDKARTALRGMADDRRHKMGVTVLKDEPDVFAFILGWEEHGVRFSITELKVE